MLNLTGAFEGLPSPQPLEPEGSGLQLQLNPQQICRGPGENRPGTLCTQLKAELIIVPCVGIHGVMCIDCKPT